MALTASGCGGSDDGDTSTDSGSGSGSDSGSGDGSGTGDGDGDGDGDTPAAPRLIAGGGVGDGAIDGVVHVYAIDAYSGAAIGGATVTIGGSELTTDASGLATFEDAGLQGAQTVTATASGYAATTFVGANGTNVTVGLKQRKADTTMLTGTISNWGQMGGNVSISGDYVLGVVLNSSKANLVSVGGQTVEQLVDMDGAPVNSCVRTIIDSSPCNWTVVVPRGGTTVPFALVLQGNTNGTIDDISDDQFELLGYAIGDAVDAGSSRSDLSLLGKRKADLDLTRVTVSMPAASGLSADIAVPFLDLGDRGQLVFPFPVVDASNPQVDLPSLAGDFADGDYQVGGLAVNDDGTQSATTIARGVTGTAQLPDWMARPSSVSATPSGFDYGPVGDAELHIGTYLDADGAPLWRVVVLGSSGSVSLPSIAGNPASGAATLRVAALDVPGLDTGDFSMADADEVVARQSEAQVDVQ